MVLKRDVVAAYCKLDCTAVASRSALRPRSLLQQDRNAADTFAVAFVGGGRCTGHANLAGAQPQHELPRAAGRAGAVSLPDEAGGDSLWTAGCRQVALCTFLDPGGFWSA